MIKKTIYSVLIILLATLLFGNTSRLSLVTRGFLENSTRLTALAEEDEEDEEEEEDEESEEDEDKEDESEDDEDSSEYEQQSEEVVMYESLELPAPIYKKVVDPGYDADTDGDGLVDAIDPNPLIHQKDFYTDSDGDSVPDALDTHQGDDDFSFVEFTDTNSNGINDLLEPTL